MPAYILRNIDATLWMRVKVRALQDGLPLRTVMLKLLRLYGEGEIVITATKTGRAVPAILRKLP